MVIALIITSIAVVILAALLLLYKRELSRMHEQLRFIRSNTTNMEVTTELQAGELVALAQEINAFIAEFKRRQIKIEASEREFKQAITNVSHDLRTPLTSAVGYLQMLGRDGISEEKQAEYLSIIERRVSAVRKMLDELFELTRIEAGEYALNLEKVNLTNVLRDTLSLYYDDFVTKGMTPTISIPGEAVYAAADSNAVKRVLQNLTGNALRHGAGDLRITLEGGKDVCIAFCNDAEMEQGDAQRLFERFYTADQQRSKRSTGLGLSIAKGLVENMGGSISAAYDGKRLTITVCFSGI